MMQAGHHEYPILLEALGELLADRYISIRATKGANLLAARAYLLAAHFSTETEQKDRLIHVANSVLQVKVLDTLSHTPYSLEMVQKELQIERDDARKWFDQLCKMERQWIAEGIDVDQKFAELYNAEPDLIYPISTVTYIKMYKVHTAIIGVLSFILIAAVWAYLRGKKHPAVQRKIDSAS